MSENLVGTSLGTLLGNLVRLQDLAHNLWWSWKPEARILFRELDPTLWHLTQHNPVKVLQNLKTERLLAAGADPSYVRRYVALLKIYDEYLTGKGS